MFGHLLEWAGNTRCVDAGPGGKVPVHWTDVRSQLRNLGEDAKYRIPKSDTLTDVAEFFAWFHHRFQFIHPFRDTNGRTGRVIDLYLLWVTFDFAGDTTLTSPIIEHFPTERHQGDYYEGLDRADRHDFAVLNAFYLDRLEATFREG
jgi:fido (protein-threonine AMPylation protein)